MIRNILFDMGNVLIRFDPPRFVRTTGLGKQEQSLLLNELFYSIEWVSLDRGTLTEEEVIERVNMRLPAPLHGAAGTLVKTWDVHSEEIPGMRELAEELAGNGYTLYLLTNAGPRHRTYWQTFPVSALFPEERIFRSADHRLLKPQAEFYEEAVRLFSLRKEECLFIDDSPANAEGAQYAGIRSVVFRQDAADLRRRLAEAGIRISQT